MIIELQGLKQPGNVAIILPHIIEWFGRVAKIWQRHEIQQELPLLVDLSRRNGIARERLVSCRVGDNDGLGGAGSWKHGLGKIALPFRGGGHGDGVSTPRLLNGPVLLGVKEEQLLSVRVEVVGNIDRAPHGETKRAEPVERL